MGGSKQIKNSCQYGNLAVFFGITEKNNIGIVLSTDSVPAKIAFCFNRNTYNKTC